MENRRSLLPTVAMLMLFLLACGPWVTAEPTVPGGPTADEPAAVGSPAATEPGKCERYKQSG